jgi:hypothetical protein
MPNDSERIRHSAFTFRIPHFITVDARLFGGACALALCAACAVPSSRPVVVSNDVAITIAPAMSDLPFDPRSARLAQATSQLTQAAGHPIAFRIDAALVPPFRTSFEETLAESIEAVARDMKSLKSDDPRTFAHEAPLFRIVDCRYAAALDRAKATFDATSGTVVVREPGSGTLVDQGAIAGALADDYGAWLDRGFAGVAPESVPRERHEDFFAWASRSRPTPKPADGHTPSEEEQFASDPRGTSLERVARFARAIGTANAALTARIDEHLVHEMYYLLLAYENDASLVRRSGPGSVFRRAEAAWVAWWTFRLPSVDDKSKLAVATHLFEARDCSDRCIPFAERFPGLDAFAWGLDIADAWVRAGHPTRGEDGDARFDLMDLVVCPVFRKADGTHDRNRGCSGGWFEIALTDQGLTRRLASALGSRDPLLVETIIANFKYSDAKPALTLWRALAPYPGAWHTAARGIVDELLDGRRETDFVAEAERIWAAMPDRRGTALYVMALADSDLADEYSDPRWSSFASRFGSDVSPTLFGAMLDESPRAVKVARVVWPALGKGWSRAEVLVPRLDRFLDDPLGRQGNDGEPGKTVRSVIKRMCSEGGNADLARLHGYLAQRAARSPTEGALLGTLVTDTAPGHCSGR